MAPATTKMEPLSDGKYAILLALIGAHSLVGGYYAATRPEGAGWRLFSWHPMLMLCGKKMKRLIVLCDDETCKEEGEDD